MSLGTKLHIISFPAARDEQGQLGPTGWHTSWGKRGPLYHTQPTQARVFFTDDIMRKIPRRVDGLIGPCSMANHNSTASLSLGLEYENIRQTGLSVGILGFPKSPSPRRLTPPTLTWNPSPSSTTSQNETRTKSG